MLTMLLLAALAADAEPEPGVKILARGAWRNAAQNGRNGIVVRAGLDLTSLLPYALLSRALEITARAATEDLAADLKVKSIDWSKQMVVFVLAGATKEGGRVEVTSVTAEKGTLTVKWKLHPAKGGKSTDSHPNEAVLLPKFTGKVIFDPPLP